MKTSRTQIGNDNHSINELSLLLKDYWLMEFKYSNVEYFLILPEYSIEILKFLLCSNFVHNESHQIIKTNN